MNSGQHAANAARRRVVRHGAVCDGEMSFFSEPVTFDDIIDRIYTAAAAAADYVVKRFAQPGSPRSVRLTTNRDKRMALLR